MMSKAYRGEPWNEHLKCVSCSSFADFGPAASFGQKEVDARRLRRCPTCSNELTPYWSPDRVREYVRQLQTHGGFFGISVVDEAKPAGWLWGYEMPDDPSSPYGPGVGMYIDVICTSPAYRNGLAAWALIVELISSAWRKRCAFLVSRTHSRAANIRRLFQRLGFTEHRASAADPDRTYWSRRLDGFSPDIRQTNYAALTRSALRAGAAAGHEPSAAEIFKQARP
jgi:ribosomal protein S18 acetylase RimI-like enzyme